MELITNETWPLAGFNIYNFMVVKPLEKKTIQYFVSEIIKISDDVDVCSICHDKRHYVLVEGICCEKIIILFRKDIFSVLS